jgi:hypothetical protein
VEQQLSDQATIEALQKECQRIAAERDLAQQTCAELQAKLDERVTILKQQRAARIALVASVAAQMYEKNCHVAAVEEALLIVGYVEQKV